MQFRQRLRVAYRDATRPGRQLLDFLARHTASFAETPDAPIATRYARRAGERVVEREGAFGVADVATATTESMRPNPRTGRSIRPIPLEQFDNVTRSTAVTIAETKDGDRIRLNFQTGVVAIIDLDNWVAVPLTRVSGPGINELNADGTLNYPRSQDLHALVTQAEAQLRMPFSEPPFALRDELEAAATIPRRVPLSSVQFGSYSYMDNDVRFPDGSVVNNGIGVNLDNHHVFIKLNHQEALDIGPVDWASSLQTPKLQGGFLAVSDKPDLLHELFPGDRSPFAALEHGAREMLGLHGPGRADFSVLLERVQERNPLGVRVPTPDLSPTSGPYLQ
jgi:hypothetical protein